MNRTRSAVMAVCVALVASAGAEDASESRAEKVQVLYKQGVVALQEGDSTLARQSFLAALRIDPGHVNSRIQLDRLKGRGGEMAALKREHQLKSYVIPKVDYDEITMPEALQALSTVVEQQSEGKFIPNFVVRDPGKAFDGRPITLQLRGVPATVVLKHLLDLADARATFDAHVIAVTPRNVGGETKGEGAGGDL